MLNCISNKVSMLKTTKSDETSKFYINEETYCVYGLESSAQ